MDIFETPVLLDLICDNLVEAVLARCLLVSKRWYALFVPYRWRYLILEHQPVPVMESTLVPFLRQIRLLPETDGQEKLPWTVIRLYGRWIRRLDLTAVTIAPLLEPDVNCTNLTRLKCHLDENGGPVNSMDALRLVAQSPRLQHLLLAGLNLDCPRTAEELIRVLGGSGHPNGTATTTIASAATTTQCGEETRGAVGTESEDSNSSQHPLPNLVHLDLACYQDVTPQCLDGILKAVPRTVRKLELALSISDEDGEAWKASRGMEMSQDEPNLTRVYKEQYRLTTINMDGCIQGIEESSFFPILRSSPDLSKLVLPKITPTLVPALAHILKTSCPQMKHLSSHDDYGIVSNTLLVDASPLLQGLELMCTHQLSASFLETLLMRSSTLTSLAIGVQARLESPDIQRIMAVCSGLTSFRIHSDLDEDIGNSALDIQDVFKSDWTCLGLRDLDIVFTFIPTDDTFHGERGQSGKDGDIVSRMVENVYRQLGRLRQLEMLAIGWVPGEGAMGVKGIDMSLSGGLDHLAGLTRLRYLDVERIPEPAIDSAEIEWLACHWPSWQSVVPTYAFGWVGRLCVVRPQVAICRP
ncbi:hypothetical protein BGZ94_001413 [Podila epigama]|nr:hypothetical protein BGZ94_001413 [Podila epigama]